MDEHETIVCYGGYYRVREHNVLKQSGSCKYVDIHNDIR